MNSKKNSKYLYSISELVKTINLELDNNQFSDAPVGIKSITSQTEGLGAVKRTTVNFRVFNYADYENIYLRYFLKPK